jgi:hypothetical protein
MTNEIENSVKEMVESLSHLEKVQMSILAMLEAIDVIAEKCQFDNKCHEVFMVGMINEFIGKLLEHFEPTFINIINSSISKHNLKIVSLQ